MKYIKLFENFDDKDDDFVQSAQPDGIEYANGEKPVQSAQPDNGFPIETAIRAAINDAEEKKEVGLLFKDFDEEGEHKDFDWSHGDPETIDSLVSLYSDQVTGMSQEDAADEIYNALAERFPELID